MPQGKGTYGSKVGRPKKPKTKNARSMPLTDKQAKKLYRLCVMRQAERSTVRKRNQC